ncbi:hypothetical protein B0H14DRAFT_3135276 [Mycena olivaceomarginata]|nr:hypothetical protein B0H14DRAFT_3135276 [Mycena olivaceomarginata]
MCSLMESIHPVLYAIINLHLKAETVESLPPEMLDNIGKFMETLHKIYTFLERQQDGNRIKYLLRNNEVQKLLRDCHAGLDQAVEVFEVTARPLWVNDIEMMKKKAQLMHEELFELIQTLSDSSTNSNRSSVVQPHFNVAFKAQDLLWSSIGSGNIMKMLNQESPRIAILGGGGMGKTSLAKAILHYPQILEKFQHRFFIELAALIGLHVGLTPGTDLTRPVVQYLSQKPPCLLILDNLETVWEPMQSRGGIEEFLSLLTEVKHLALLITMRGAERPSKVHWTHPVLLPLQPLSAEAAQQTFMDITDNAYIKEDMEQILQFTDNMPLAVDLIAHLADYEGLSNVLSLSSPRITSESKELLSLLSILPDGLSDGELVQYKLPIRNILSCKTALLATSLAYQDSNRRLRLTGRGYRGLLDSILPILPGLDPQLQLHFITEVLRSSAYYPSLDREQFIMQAPNMIEQINNSLLECKFYHAAGLYFLCFRLDMRQAMQFYNKALDLSRSCQDTNEQCNALLSIAELKCRDYCTAQAHIAEALQLSKSAPNLFQEANALYIGALCSTYLGNFLQAIENQHRGRIILGICGLAGGNLDHIMAIEQGEIHFLKSEYAQARSIYSGIVETNPPKQNARYYALSLLNIVHIDTMCGDMMHVYHKLSQAKEIFNKFASPTEIIYCNAIEANIELREKKFDLAKIRFQECLHSTWRTDNEVESFCLERLADITAWPSSEWRFRWPVTYLGYAYKQKITLPFTKHFSAWEIRAQCMIRLGDLANKQKHISKAISLWQTAQPLFERSFQATDVAQIDVRLSAAEKRDQEALTTLTAPDQWLNTGSSEIQQVGGAHLKGSEGVVSVLMPC